MLYSMAVAFPCLRTYMLIGNIYMIVYLIKKEGIFHLFKSFAKQMEAFTVLNFRTE